MDNAPVYRVSVAVIISMLLLVIYINYSDSERYLDSLNKAKAHISQYQKLVSKMQGSK